MPWLAAAGAVGGSLISGFMGQSAANTQAQGAEQSAQTAANAQLQAQKFQQAQEQPYQTAGANALNQYTSLLNGGATNFDPSKLPGYKFEMQQGTQAIENSAAARGTSLSGNTLQSLQSYGQGQASQGFQQYMQQLAGVANMGQSAASNVGNTGAQLLSGAGASLAAGQMGAANAQSAATANWGNAINSGISNASTGYYNQQLLSSLFAGGQGGGMPSTGAGYVDPSANPGAYGYSSAASGALPYGQ